MVVFVTLLLGLATGLQPIQVQVDDAVARVDILLDGALVGTLRGEPWKQTCDLGGELQPHTLDAVAYDVEGLEVDRVRQWLNLPRDPAEVSLLVSGSEDGRGAVARVHWQSVLVSEPTGVQATFNGTKLEVEDVERIALPDHDPTQLHLLRVQLDFPENVTSIADVAFGGIFADEVQTELTGLPVLLVAKTDLPPLAALQDWFVANGQELRVVAVEEGPSEIVAVVDRATRDAVRTMMRTARGMGVGGGLSGNAQLKRLMPLRREQILRFISPYSRDREAGSQAFHLFNHSQDLTVDDGGFLYQVTRYMPPLDGGDQRLADALAVAAISAATRDRRRVVVLFTSGAPEDSSSFSGAKVRGYLESLRVPLFVWATEPIAPDLAAQWGEPSDVSSLSRLEKRMRQLVDHLKRQRIVWIEGAHLPQSIALSAAAEGVQIAR